MFFFIASSLGEGRRAPACRGRGTAGSQSAGGRGGTRTWTLAAPSRPRLEASKSMYPKLIYKNPECLCTGSYSIAKRANFGTPQIYKNVSWMWKDSTFMIIKKNRGNMRGGELPLNTYLLVPLCTSSPWCASASVGWPAWGQRWGRPPATWGS